MELRKFPQIINLIQGCVLAFFKSEARVEFILILYEMLFHTILRAHLTCTHDPVTLLAAQVGNAGPRATGSFPDQIRQSLRTPAILTRRV